MKDSSGKPKLMKDALVTCHESLANNEIAIQIMLVIDIDGNMAGGYIGCTPEEARKQMKRYIKTVSVDTKWNQ